jgi:hypothetical protein
MPSTRSFNETVQARARRDPAFREALLAEVIDTLLAGDVDTPNAVLRDTFDALDGPKGPGG